MAKAAIFDIDGTLIDSVDLHAAAWREAFRRFGHDVSHDAVRNQIGKGGDQLMPVFVPEAELRERGGEIEACRKDLFARRYLPEARAFPGVRPLFERLRGAGLRVVLASSCKDDEAGHYQRLAGIEDLVGGVTCSDEAERSKPHPDIFEAALAKLAPLGPADAVVVGDSPYDAEAAGKAGLKTIGLLCGGFPEADLRAAGCVEVYRDPEDLLRNLEGSLLAGTS